MILATSSVHMQHMLNKVSDAEGKQNGLSTRDKSIKLVNFIDMASIK